MKLLRIFLKIIVWIFVFIVAVLVFSPYYLRKGLIHWYADLDDYKHDYNNEVGIANNISDWEKAPSYNTKELSEKALSQLDTWETTAFVVIQDKKLIYEKYWLGSSDTTASNMFSTTKSIVSLLIGIAVDKGEISSIDEPIGQYIPEFANDDRGKITIRNILTMSSGLEWNEVYTNPFSVTTKAYYGNNLRELATTRKLVTTPGKNFNYQSVDTQILSFILEAATGKTISKYAEENLWIPIGANHIAIWSKDKEDGDERAFCCFNTNAKDIARIGQLVLNGGRWNGKQIVSESYIKEATRPASYIKDEGKPLKQYGLQWWIRYAQGMTIPCTRGHKGQFVFVVPDKNAVIVRLGKKSSSDYMFLNIGLSLLK